MNKTIQFNSRYKHYKWMGLRTDKELKKEPMFFGASLWYAYFRGGPITREFLSKVPGEYWRDGIFDSRLHMLMPGWYPCIPGWHHDDVMRTGRRQGQPDYIAQFARAKHMMSVISYPRNIAMPEMLTGNVEVSNPERLSKVYSTWDSEINKMNPGITTNPNVTTLESGQIVEFDSHTFHRGMKAKANCWRWFGRVTINPCNMLRVYANEMRKQVNVYMDKTNEGW